MLVVSLHFCWILQRNQQAMTCMVGAIRHAIAWLHVRHCCLMTLAVPGLDDYIAWEDIVRHKQAQENFSEVALCQTDFSYAAEHFFFCHPIQV